MRRKTLHRLGALVLAVAACAGVAPVLAGDGYPLLLFGGKKNPYLLSSIFTVAAGGSVSVTTTVAAGTVDYAWGDGATSLAVASGVAATHTYTDAGTYSLTLRPSAGNSAVTAMDFGNSAVKFTLTAFQRYTSMASLVAAGNAATVVSGDTSTIPTGLQVLHLYSTSSTITGTLATIPTGLREFYLYSTPSTITGTLATIPTGLQALNLGSTSSTITGTLATIPAGLQGLNLGNTPSTITGTLATIPAGLQGLNLGSTPSTITGTLATIPAGLQGLDLGGTSSTITGGTGAPLATALSFIELSYTGMLTAAVDDVVGYLYTYRASWTNGAPTLGVGGSNQTPSGIYQSVTPPTTGKETIYDLVNDPTAQGFHKWSITYTP